MPHNYSACAILPGRWPCLENWEVMSHLLCLQFMTHLQAITITAFSVSPAIPLQCNWITKAKTKPCKLQSFCLMEDNVPEKADEIICACCPQFSASLLVGLHWGSFVFQFACAMAHWLIPAQHPKEPPRWPELPPATFRKLSLGAIAPPLALPTGFLYSKASLSSDRHGQEWGDDKADGGGGTYSPTPDN